MKLFSLLPKKLTHLACNSPPRTISDLSQKVAGKCSGCRKG